MSNGNQDESAGLSGSIRAVLGLLVLAFALLGILVVLDVIPRESVGEIAQKGLLIAAIVVGSAVAMGLLSRR
jgi:hypothetical protein